MSQVKHDLETVGKKIGDTLMDQLGSILDSGTEALEGPVREISARLAIAAARKNQALMEACQDQLELVLKEGKIEVRGEGNQMVAFLVDNGITMLVNGTIAGMAGMRVTP